MTSTTKPRSGDTTDKGGQNVPVPGIAHTALTVTDLPRSTPDTLGSSEAASAAPNEVVTGVVQAIGPGLALGWAADRVVRDRPSRRRSGCKERRSAEGRRACPG